MKNLKTCTDFGNRMTTLQINDTEVELQMDHHHSKDFQLLQHTDSEDFTSATSDRLSSVREMATFTPGTRSDVNDLQEFTQSLSDNSEDTFPVLMNGEELSFDHRRSQPDLINLMKNTRLRENRDLDNEGEEASTAHVISCRLS